MKKKYIVNQRTMDANINQLARLEFMPEKAFVYKRTMDIQDLDGDRFRYVIELRQNENCMLVFIGNQWVGRALYFTDLTTLIKLLTKNIF